MAKLFAPASYWSAKGDGTLHQVIDGGCGGGKVGDYFVPDTIWFLDVQPACEIHDWMYAMGETAEDKVIADRTFLNNMVRLIRAGTKWKWLKKLRLHRAHTYWWAVHRFGGPAFWNDKNETTTYRDPEYPHILIAP